MNFTLFLTRMLLIFFVFPCPPFGHQKSVTTSDKLQVSWIFDKILNLITSSYLKNPEKQQQHREILFFLKKI